MTLIHCGYYRGWYHNVCFDVLRTWHGKTKVEGWGFGLWDAQYRDDQIYRYKREAMIAAQKYIDTHWPEAGTKPSSVPFLTKPPWLYGEDEVFDHRLSPD